MKNVLYMVVPCYNEEEVLHETAKRLAEKYDSLISRELFGVGMCCTMINDWEKYFALGIVIGIVGIIGVIAAYPVYSYMVKRKKAKLAPEIIRLSDELIK